MSRGTFVAALVALLALPGLASGASLDASPIGTPPVPTRATSPLFAAGGSALTNGVFFPGTAIYDGGELKGVPYEVPQGNDIEFYTSDSSVTLGNGHQIRSFKNRKNGRPMFLSKFLVGPGSTLMITSHLKPGRGELPDGSYGYFCSVHNNQYGILKIVP